MTGMAQRRASVLAGSNLWFYPKLSGHDLHLFRSPGPGLGNLLFPWARAEIYAHDSGGRAISPTWRNLKLGTILRREADARTYGDVFRHRPAGTWLADGLRKTRLRRIPESAYLGGKLPGGETIVEVEGMADSFRDLRGAGPFIRERLEAIARTPFPSPTPFIGLHIRAGDFGTAVENRYKRNTRIEPEWFVGELQRLCEVLGPLPAVIFTDDVTGTVARAFGEAADVSIAPQATALAGIMRLATAAHIVCSNSTFSLWSAYLSSGTVSVRYTELLDDYGLDDPAFLSRVL